MIGSRLLRVQWFLQIFPPPQLRFGPTSCLGHTPYTIAPCRIHENQRITFGVQPDLQQFRSVENDDRHIRVGLVLRHQHATPLTDARIQQILEPLQLVGPVEDHGADAAAVHATVGTTNVRAPPLPDGLNHLGISEHFVPEPI